MDHRLGLPPLFALAALIAAAALLAGCVTDYQPGVATAEDGSAYPEVAILGNLGGGVRKHAPIVTPGERGRPMAVSVPLRLMSDRTREVQYRFIFMDQRGKPLPPEMDWTWKVMPARALVYFEAAALDDRATDWRLEVRPYKEN